MAPEIDIEVSGPGVKGRAKASVRSDRTVKVALIVGGTVLAVVTILSIFALLLASMD